MANATWPPTLPQIPLKGSSGSFGEGRLLSPMDSGPDKARQRFTATFDPRQAVVEMTGDQLVVFQDFWRTTLAQGSLPFDWTDPTADTVVDLRFATPPSWQEIRTGPTAAQRLYRVSLALEVQP